MGNGLWRLQPIAMRHRMRGTHAGRGRVVGTARRRRCKPGCSVIKLCLWASCACEASCWHLTLHASHVQVRSRWTPALETWRPRVHGVQLKVSAAPPVDACRRLELLVWSGRHCCGGV